MYCSKYLLLWVALRKAFPSEIYCVALLFLPRVNLKRRLNVCCYDYYPVLFLCSLETSMFFFISVKAYRHFLFNTFVFM